MAAIHLIVSGEMCYFSDRFTQKCYEKLFPFHDLKSLQAFDVFF